MAGDVWNAKGTRVGRVHSDGEVFKERGFKVGRVFTDGNVFKGGSKVGRVFTDGDIWKGRVKAGKIGSDSDVWNAQGVRVGKVFNIGEDENASCCLSPLRREVLTSNSQASCG